MKCCRHLTGQNILLTVLLSYIQLQYNAVLCATNLPWAQSSCTGAAPASQPIFMCWGEPCQPVSIHNTQVRVNIIGSHCGSGINSQSVTPGRAFEGNFSNVCWWMRIRLWDKSSDIEECVNLTHTHMCGSDCDTNTVGKIHCFFTFYRLTNRNCTRFSWFTGTNQTLLIRCNRYTSGVKVHG